MPTVAPTARSRSNDRNHDDRRFIVVEGPLGSGKTALTKLLAARQQAKLVLSEPNPFCSRFFKEMEKYAFQYQIFSLLSHYHQLKEILQVDLFSKGVMADYLFTSEHIFAEQHLTDEEFFLYDKLLRAMDVQAAVPDLVIYLQATPAMLHERLRKSGLEYAQHVPLDYLEAVVGAYNRYFFDYTLSALLVVNIENVDFFSEEIYVEKLVHELAGVKSGVHHFVPHER